MQIRFQPSPSGSPVELAGTGRSAAADLRVAFADQVQVVAPARAVSATVFHRGGRLYTLSWSAAREHASQAVAEAYLLDHAEAIPRASGRLVLTGGGGGGGSAARTFDPATVRISESRAIGRTTLHTYEAQGRAA